MNYTNLQAAVVDYLHRSDISTGSPTKCQDFIERARVRIGRELRSLEQEVSGTVSSFTASVGALPTDFLEMIKVEVNGVGLRAVNHHEMQYWADNASPEVYAIYNRNLFCPGATSATILYYRQEAALSSGATEHATMSAHPQLWIYAAVREGAIWTHDLELAQVMDQAFKDEVAQINSAARMGRYGIAPATIDSGMNTFAGSPGL